MSRWRGLQRGMAAVLTVTAVAGATLGGATPAAAYQNPAVTVAGPSGAVVDLGGVAMSPDGRSGGVVYRQIVNGRTHIFVAPYLNGRWRAPQQVDAGQVYDSLFPRLGAGNDGQLVVVWVQRHGAYSDQLWSARLGAGSQGFDHAAVVDPNIGSASATFPSLAVAPDGTAYVSYVVEPPAVNGTGNLTAQTPTADGSVVLQYRLARILATSSSLYPPLNRRSGVPDPIPTASTAPQVAIDADDDAAVAWEEPDDQAIPRVWARRIYRYGVGSLEQISTDPLGGKPMPAAAGAFSIALAGRGDGAIVYLQQPIAGSVLTAPRLLLARLVGPRAGQAPSASAQFQAPQPADGLGPFAAGYGGTLGPPQVAVSSDGLVGVGYTLNNQVRLAGDGVLNVGGFANADTNQPPFALEVGKGGAAVLAWPQDAGGGTLAVRERTFNGRVQTGSASAQFPGPVNTVQAAGSTLGDGLVAFEQGNGDAAQIGAVVVDAPPVPFTVNQPDGWLQRRGASVSWQAAPAAYGTVTYRLYVDGRLRVRTRDTSATIASWVREDGRHHISVIATDGHGQSTQAPRVTISVDGTRPAVTLQQGSPYTQVGRRTLRVTVTDKASGVDPRRTTVYWGDGADSTGARLRHFYAHTGRYRVVVSAYDNAGNRHRYVQRVAII